jgi:hypothetical protein
MARSGDVPPGVGQAQQSKNPFDNVVITLSDLIRDVA